MFNNIEHWHVLSWDSVGADSETWVLAGYLRGDSRKQNWKNGESEMDEGENPIWFSEMSWLLHLNSTEDLCRITEHVSYNRPNTGRGAAAFIHQLSYPTGEVPVLTPPYA